MSHALLDRLWRIAASKIVPYILTHIAGNLDAHLPNGYTEAVNTPLPPILDFALVCASQMSGSGRVMREPMSFFKERRVLKDMAPSVRLDEVHTQNCRVLPTRMHLLSCLPRGGVVAEIGAAFGDFTKQILERNRPKKLHLVDAWASNRYQQGLTQIPERFTEEIALRRD